MLAVGRTSAIAVAIAVMAIAAGARWSLGELITRELDEAGREMGARLEAAVGGIRTEIRAGREATERQMNELRAWCRPAVDELLQGWRR